ncbi:uncharacterized protein G2W53_007899 [Senna tora]|uniref:Uncharacterized protein n=1 Tax=Senna tora TaxID=362788 RepID=A0A835CHN7_9FABA|nr:uncharacterized protein G2W53_007899 [Senna tora]
MPCRCLDTSIPNSYLFEISNVSLPHNANFMTLRFHVATCIGIFEYSSSIRISRKSSIHANVTTSSPNVATSTLKIVAPSLEVARATVEWEESTRMRCCDRCVLWDGLEDVGGLGPATSAAVSSEVYSKKAFGSVVGRHDDKKDLVCDLGE